MPVVPDPADAERLLEIESEAFSRGVAAANLHAPDFRYPLADSDAVLAALGDLIEDYTATSDEDEEHAETILVEAYDYAYAIEIGYIERQGEGVPNV